MDTDDSIDEENARKVAELPARPVPAHVMGYLMKVRCPHSRSNGDGAFVAVDHVKLFRNLPPLRFEFRIHEQILLSIRRARGTVEWTDIFLVHSGADQSPEGRAKKLARDLRLLALEQKDRPDHPFTLFNLGMTYAEAGDHERAIGFLWQSIGRSGDDDSQLAKAYALLVASYRQLGRHGTAWETCAKGLKQFPNDPELRYRRAMSLREFGRVAEATRAFEELRELRTAPHLSSADNGLTTYRAGHNLAEMYAEQGEFEKAERAWRQVVRDAPWFAPAWHGLAHHLQRQGREDDVSRLVEHMQTNHQVADEARRLRIDLHIRRGDYQVALDGLNEALQEDPYDLVFLETRCRLLFEHFPPAEAEASFRALLDRDGGNPAAYHNLGTIHYKLGRFDEAAAAYRRSIELRPDCASTHLHLGYALREGHKMSEAIAAWRRVLEIEPNHALALAALEEATRA